MGFGVVVVKLHEGHQFHALLKVCSDIVPFMYHNHDSTKRE